VPFSIAQGQSAAPEADKKYGRMGATLQGCRDYVKR
jgi:hypothetical protein